MSYRIAIAASLLSASALTHAAAPCMEKKQAIEQEIGYAERHQNQHRINGLKKALNEVQAHCSDEEVRAQHQKKITAQRDKVAQREHELTAAQAKGDAEKVSHKRQKLTEARRELKALEARDY